MRGRCLRTTGTACWYIASITCLQTHRGIPLKRRGWVLRGPAISLNIIIPISGTSHILHSYPYRTRRPSGDCPNTTCTIFSWPLATYCFWYPSLPEVYCQKKKSTYPKGHPRRRRLLFLEPERRGWMRSEDRIKFWQRNMYDRWRQVDSTIKESGNRNAEREWMPITK